MKKILGLFFLMLLTINISCQREDNLTTECDFRKAVWEMSKNEVKASENSKIVDEDDDMIVYKSTLSGLNCLVGYYFTNNELNSGSYRIKEEHTKEALKIGIKSESDLKKVGSENAIIKISTLENNGACLNMLYALEGAIQRIRWHNLDKEKKQELKDFYNILNK